MARENKKKTGVLLVNLGTPNSASVSDDYHYLIEFLTDGRVIDIPWLQRQLLVRGVIVPSRCRQSARAYQAIWTETGSPLKLYGYAVRDKLQETLGHGFFVELAMRYQEPSLSGAMMRFKQTQLDRLVILPLFPQYASATTGSVHQKVMEIVSKEQVVPEIIFINNFATDEGLIASFCAAAESFHLDSYDHILFSFHGLPKRQLHKADKSDKCFKSNHCCDRQTADNMHCYSAQCYATARALAEALGLTKNRYSISFQSRLGKEPWLEPFTGEVVQQLAKQAKKRVLVFCPSFVCDCLETLYEIGIEYAEEFKHAGGELLELVPGLNDHPVWIEALGSLVKKHLGMGSIKPIGLEPACVVL
jgi:ferrochelatase